MDANNSINVKKRIYDSGLVFNINKLNFNWKDLYKFEELKKIDSRRNIDSSKIFKQLYKFKEGK